MKIISTRISLLLLLIVLTAPNIAGQHGWTVNPEDFAYYGEVIAIIILDSEEVTEGTLGAFVDGECRGLGDASYFWFTGKTIFSVTCYSNQSRGEILSFQYYDPGGEGTYYDIDETIEFTAHMKEGRSWAPLEFHITVKIPDAPVVGEISPPTCTVSTGSVNLSGLPEAGSWTLTMYPGTITTSGSGSSTTISGLEAGTYNFTVSNSAGYTSVPSSNVVIPPQPPIPAAPVIGLIVQPTHEVPTGSLVLIGLPSSGSWTVTRTPGNLITTGTGTSITITGLEPGVFNFTVTNSYGCTSLESADVYIAMLEIPTIIITEPDPACYPETVDLTADAITEGSTPGFTYTYWLDSEAAQEYSTPTEATEGTYYIRGTTETGYFDIKPVVVTIDQPPVADAGPDQVLNFVFDTELNAAPVGQGHGTWTVVKGSGIIDNDTLAVTPVSDLALNANVFMWTVSSGICPSARDSVTILVNDFIIPTLITPNNDPYNEYFVLSGLKTFGRTELIIFDRRGTLVYKNDNYDNRWNGVDQDGNQLPADTYFYTIKPTNGNPLCGYIVIQR